jgi:hypothetical protein
MEDVVIDINRIYTVSNEVIIENHNIHFNKEKDTKPIIVTATKKRGREKENGELPRRYPKRHCRKSIKTNFAYYNVY